MRHIVLTALFLLSIGSTAAAQNPTVTVGCLADGPALEGTHCVTVTVTREADDSLTVDFSWDAEWPAALAAVTGRAVLSYAVYVSDTGEQAYGILTIPDPEALSARTTVPADRPPAMADSLAESWVYAYDVADPFQAGGPVGGLAAGNAPVPPAGTPVPALPVAGLALLAAGLAAAGLRRLNA